MGVALCGRVFHHGKQRLVVVSEGRESGSP